MNDRELLEAAAKAAGIDAEFHPELGYGPEGMWLKGKRSPDNSKYWNPLTDDGDALRLVVKLKLWLRYRDDASVNVCWYDEAGVFAGNVTEEWGSLRNGDEPNAHVRRAIVRAAAETSRAKGGSET